LDVRKFPILLAMVLCGAVAPAARAETRVEGLSSRTHTEMLQPDLVEVDVAQKGSIGFRSTPLGGRSTNEIFVRINKDTTNKPMDPRDQRSAVKGSLFEATGFHVGLAGVDVDGTRGNPHSLRLGLYTTKRMSEKVMGISEFAYQTGTFGGEEDRLQNKGGLHSRVGARFKLGKGAYGVTQYTFTPGRDSRWTPEFRVGVGF